MGRITTEKSDKDFHWKKREFDIDIPRAHFELDALQEELLNRYLRGDKTFLRAFNTNYTSLFMEFLKDKTRLNEPIALAVMGGVRMGKSVSAITIAGLVMEARGRLMDVELIMANEYVFLDEIKNAKFGDFYVIDESKHAMYGTGSSTRKSKIQDIQNIIAVNNISTLWLTPDRWASEKVQYGLRAFGRSQYYSNGEKMPIRICRFMLYNLQESSAGGSVPLGMVYIPHFEDILENGTQLWKDYSEKKQKWVDEEVSGTAGDMMEQMFSVAEKINNSDKFKLLSKKAEKITFITALLGSEISKGEIDQVFQCINLLNKGFTI